MLKASADQVIRCRSPVIWRAAAKVAYQGTQFYTQFPKKLQVIGLPSSSKTTLNQFTAESNILYNTFVSKMESFLSTNATALNWTASWEHSKPDPALPSLLKILNTTYAVIIGKEQTKLLRAPFYADYAKIHDGRRPAIDTPPRVSVLRSYRRRGNRANRF